MKNDYKIKTSASFCYLTPSTSQISITVICILLPQILLLFFSKSFLSIFIILICVFASCSVEIISNFIRKKPLFTDFISVVQGICIGFFVPQNYPLIPIFFITFLALLLVKYIFNGNAHSWVNPVVWTVIVLFFLGQSFFPQSLVTVQILESGNPSNALIQNGEFSTIATDKSITLWLNEYIFDHFSIEIPEGYISLFWDTNSSIPAFRFNFLTLLASIFLISLGMINWIVPVVFLGVYIVLVRVFGLFPFTGVYGQGDILLSLLTGGTLFSTFFILDWYGTSPLSRITKIIYGIIGGVIAFFLNGLGTSSIGMCFTILLMNIISICLQMLEEKIHAYIICKKINNKTLKDKK